VHDQILGKLQFDFTDLGELRLKNIERTIRAYALTNTRQAHSTNQQAPASPGPGATNFDISRFRRPSIIVMPFKELGGADNASLAEGLRLSLHSVLIKLPGFFLLHTGAVEGYRGQDYSAAEVGNAIDVRYVVGGAVQCVGERVRATIELTDTSSRQMVWGETYDRILDDVFALQDEIALEIVKALDIVLRAGDVGRLRFETISNPSARECFYRGISHLYGGNRENTLSARGMLEKVDAMEPDNPACLSMIALTYWREAKFGWSDDRASSLKMASNYAQKTVDLGDPEGVGHTIMGYVRLQQGRHEDAMVLSAEALSRRPSCPLSNGLLAEVMRYCGNPDQAVARIKEAMKLAKIFPPWMIDNLAAALRDNNQVEASISAAKEAVGLFPDDLDVLVTLCCDYDWSSMSTEAETVARQILAADPSFSIARYAESQPYKDKAVLDRIIESLSRAGLPE
jgi:TolB-like protein